MTCARLLVAHSHSDTPGSRALTHLGHDRSGTGMRALIHRNLPSLSLFRCDFPDRLSLRLGFAAFL
ncbi:hypothetical protein THICB3620270 [Thiomonas sp. CB3]|nr:hypothetical protein THICB3620270 [Thiomonas sp. CB3]